MTAAPSLPPTWCRISREPKAARYRSLLAELIPSDARKFLWFLTLFRLTGCPLRRATFAERALALLSANWCAVTALASARVEDRRIEGERVEAIIDAA